ncbi:hypothetical protein J7E71_20785 [Mesobacillus foraminis]|nr:hypothetical protein [Mesobacillus foraminis]
MSELPQGGAIKEHAKGIAAGEIPGVGPFGEEPAEKRKKLDKEKER